jgi:hypothetical protein
LRTALSPRRDQALAYQANRQALAEHVIVEQTILENVVEADPVASCVRNIMQSRDQWDETEAAAWTT